MSLDAALHARLATSALLSGSTGGVALLLAVCSSDEILPLGAALAASVLLPLGRLFGLSAVVMRSTRRRGISLRQVILEILSFLCTLVSCCLFAASLGESESWGVEKDEKSRVAFAQVPLSPETSLPCSSEILSWTPHFTSPTSDGEVRMDEERPSGGLEDLRQKAAEITLKHLKTAERSLQPELLAKMPALYESLAEALSGVRAQDAGFQKAQAQAEVDDRVAQLERQLAQKEISLATLEQASSLDLESIDLLSDATSEAESRDERLEVRQSAGAISDVADLHPAQDGTGANSADANQTGSSKYSPFGSMRANCINRSLSALADVLFALGDSTSSAHVPYRNSKLTYLLQDALGGPGCKTFLFAQVSPDALDANESYSTLTFASRVATSVQKGRLRPRGAVPLALATVSQMRQLGRQGLSWVYFPPTATHRRVKAQLPWIVASSLMLTLFCMVLMMATSSFSFGSWLCTGLVVFASVELQEIFLEGIVGPSSAEGSELLEALVQPLSCEGPGLSRWLALAALAHAVVYRHQGQMLSKTTAFGYPMDIQPPAFAAQVFGTRSKAVSMSTSGLQAPDGRSFFAVYLQSGLEVLREFTIRVQCIVAASRHKGAKALDLSQLQVLEADVLQLAPLMRRACS
eukprot:g21853.t1